MNALKRLHEHGQSPWLDFIRRALLTSGELRRLIDEDGITGVTSNPSIFEKAISGSDDYRADLQRLRGEGLTAEGIYERLAIADVQGAADALRPVYDRTGRQDGYVSLEVSPRLAHDTAGTLDEARRLWTAVGRENLMIKVPGTPAGMPAVQALIADGINVNVTLLFSRAAYRASAQAYVDGLAQRAAAGKPVAGIASVASFFVSRIDTAVDARLDRAVAAASGATRDGLASLRGKAAIANARLAYQHFQSLVATQAWQRLAAQGAMPQRLLWASTSTKNPAYRDVLYVEELIGPATVNTMPVATIEAFRDHGVPRASLAEDVAGAEATMAALREAGIDLDEITSTLLVEGVDQFAQSFDSLLGAVGRAD